MKIAIVALLGLHGVIHTMGFAGAWGLATFEGASPVPTNIVSAEPGGALVRILGLVWLLALAAFLLAAYLLVVGSATWRVGAVVAVAISMVPISLWWKDAPMGAVANALVLVAVIAAPRLEGVPA